MTRLEATTEAARLSREHPDRGTFTWMPRQTAGGDWEVARLNLPSPSTAARHTGTAEKPIAPRDDPRPRLPPDHVGF